MRLVAATPEERLVRFAMRWTFGFYLVGGLYILGPALGWSLAALVALRWLGERRAGGPSQPIRVPLSIGIWAAAMGILLVALVVAHVDGGLGTTQTIKSAIGWAKGWALLALFPLAGTLRIRPRVLYRGACEIGLQALVLLPLCVVAAHLGLPEVLWVSPTSAVGGPGPEFFAVRLYSIDPGGGFRYWLFTPWAPALGFVANIYLALALRETSTLWRAAGVAGALVMIVASGSRLALVALVLVHLATWALSNVLRPARWLAAGGAALTASLLSHPIATASEALLRRFHGARAESSRVRSALGRVAVDRWRDEAPVWGHGVVERGPHLVEFMPIGSHHTWYGLLFVKGAVGFAALAVAMVSSLLTLLVKSQQSREARVGLAVLLTLFLYSFGENLEILAYLLWPGLIALGMGLAAPWPAAARALAAWIVGDGAREVARAS